MYSLAGHGHFISDSTRIDAYAEALGSLVNSESVVLDIGTGVGIFALLACKFGARKVYAIEPGDVIEVARENARINGYAGRIEFIQGVSTQAQIPEQVNLIVSDMRGVTPFFRDHIPSIIDARERFLASDGTLLPQRDRLWAAPAEAPDLYEDNLGIWERPLHELSFSTARQLEANAWWKTRLKAEQLISDPKCWADLDYLKIESPNASATLDWRIEEPRTAHGLIVWFDVELIDKLGFSNAPGAVKTVYGSAFFPFSTPLDLEPGDKLIVSLQTHYVSGDHVWKWSTLLLTAGSTQAKQELKQSTFYAIPYSASSLRSRSATHVPTLDNNGQVESLILSLIDGRRSIQDIAHYVLERFPDRFQSLTAAMAQTVEVSTKHGA